MATLHSKTTGVSTRSASRQSQLVAAKPLASKFCFQSCSRQQIGQATTVRGARQVSSPAPAVVSHSTNWPVQPLQLLFHQSHCCQRSWGPALGQHCFLVVRGCTTSAFSCAEAFSLLCTVSQVVSVAQVEQATSPELELPAGYHW